MGNASLHAHTESHWIGVGEGGGGGGGVVHASDRKPPPPCEQAHKHVHTEPGGEHCPSVAEHVLAASSRSQFPPLEQIPG